MIEIFKKYGFPNYGRLISGSKSTYRQNFPDNEVMFNANIFTKSKGKVWYGDLDITKDAGNLQKICNVLNEEMFIIPEMLGRFGRPNEEIYENSHVKFIPNSDSYMLRVYDGLTSVEVDGMSIVTGKGIDWKKNKIK